MQVDDGIRANCCKGGASINASHTAMRRPPTSPTVSFGFVEASFALRFGEIIGSVIMTDRCAAGSEDFVTVFVLIPRSSAPISILAARSAS